MKAPERWVRRADSFQERVLGIKDDDLRFAVSVILSCLHDGEDDCAWAVFAPENELRVLGVQIDGDISEALVAQVGEACLGQAIRWLQEQLDGQDPAWAAWVLHRVKVQGVEGMTEVVGKDGVVYDIGVRRITRRSRKR